MSTEQGAPGGPRFEVRVTSDSHFAWVRTRLAVERTMMAYVRTSVSLIAFGFTIFQFIQRVQEVRADELRFPYAAWWLGLALILAGVAASIVSLWEYRRQINYLWSGIYAAVAGEQQEPGFTSLYVFTMVLIFIGLFAFFAVLLSVPSSALPWSGA
jgi:putative membrane protein